MSKLSVNIVANFGGRVFTVALGIAFVPIYVSMLGVEGYGLIGLFAALQSIIQLFDLGLGTTLTRQLALDAADGKRGSQMRDFTRTVELTYWLGAIVIGLLGVALAPFAANSWLRPGAIPVADVSTALTLMCVAAALQFPFAMYGGGLMGLQRQVSYNAALAAIGTVRSVGAVVVLNYVSPTVGAFFLWQVVISALQSFLGAVLLWRQLPPGEPARFHFDHLRRVWRFAAGTAGTTTLGILRSQIDKVLLTRLLSLEQFGYYSLAGVLGSGVYFLAQPFYMAYFPRFASFVADAKEGTARLTREYHEACQLLSSIVMPAVAVAAVFASQVILVWTNDATIAANTSIVASVLVVSFGLVALNGLPYTLQLASGWTRLGFIVSAATLALAIPLIFYATRSSGPIGAASAWLVINAVYLLALVHGMHRSLLVGEVWRWYLVDVGVPTLASIAVVGLGYVLIPAPFSRLGLAAYIAAVSVAAVAAAVAVTPFPRQTAMATFRRIFAIA